MTAQEVTSRHQRRDLTMVAVVYGVSIAGTTAAFVAMVLQLRGAGSGWIMALLLAEIAPLVVLAPLAGTVVDRVEARSLLIWVNSTQAVMNLWLSTVMDSAAVVALVAGLGALSALERPAIAALVPHITGEAGATRGYACLSTGKTLGAIVGPVVGGIISVNGGIRDALLINGASCLLVAAALFMVDARRHPGRRAAADDSAMAGFGVIRDDSILRLAIPLTAIAAGIALADNIAAPYRISDDFNGGSIGLGVYEALYSVSELIGIRLLTVAARRGALEHRLLAAGNMMLGLGILGIGLAPGLALALGAAVIGGIGNGMSNAGEVAVIRLRTPEHLRGRAFAASSALIQATSIAGVTAAAPAVATIGAAHTMIVSGALAATVALIALVLLRRSVRTARLPEATSVPPVGWQP